MVGLMKIQQGHRRGADQSPRPARQLRRRSVAAILREAYRRFTGDADTRRAVRRGLS